MDEKPEKKQRSEKQKAATAKALAALKARREMAQGMIDDHMKKEVEEAEERIVSKVMSRMGVIKKEEEEEPIVKKAVKKAVEVAAPEKKKKVIVVEEESSSEEEVIIQKVKKTKAPASEVKAVPAAAIPVRTTGNKLLDRMYFGT